MSTSVFYGIVPALMTPCKPDRTPDFDEFHARRYTALQPHFEAQGE